MSYTLNYSYKNNGFSFSVPSLERLAQMICGLKEMASKNGVVFKIISVEVMRPINQPEQDTLDALTKKYESKT